MEGRLALLLTIFPRSLAMMKVSSVLAYPTTKDLVVSYIGVTVKVMNGARFLTWEILKTKKNVMFLLMRRNSLI